MTPLVMHYAPGILAILKRNPCLNPRHNEHTGCDRNTHTYYTIVNVGIVPDEEAAWLLEQSWIRPKAEI